MVDPRFARLPKLTPEITKLFETLAQLEITRQRLLREHTEASDAVPAAARADREAAARALIDGTAPPPPTAKAEAELRVAQLERDLHFNLREAFGTVEAEIAAALAKTRKSYAPDIAKRIETRRTQAKETIAQLSEALGDIARDSAALAWTEQPTGNNGSLRAFAPTRPLLLIGGREYSLERVWDVLAGQLDPTRPGRRRSRCRERRTVSSIMSRRNFRSVRTA